MIDKSTYLNLKREIKCYCRKNVMKLCDDMELTDIERTLLLDFYNNELVVHTCIKLCISEKTHSKYMRILFSKIYDYKNTQ